MSESEDFVELLVVFHLPDQIDIDKLCDEHITKSPRNGYGSTNSLESYENINVIQNSQLKIEKPKTISLYNEHENNLVNSYITENAFFEVGCIEPPKESNGIIEEEIVLKLEDIENNKDNTNVNINFSVNIEQPPLVKQAKYIDIRKAPEFNVQITHKEKENELVEDDADAKLEKCDVQTSTAANLCNNCGTKHNQDQCLLYTPYYMLNDSITYENWKHKHKEIISKSKSFLDKLDQLENGVQNYDDIKDTFAYLSLPTELCFEDTGTPHGLGVFSKSNLKEFTQMGPIIGKSVKEVDIPEECNMRDLWEIVTTEKSHIYISTADFSDSNWIRFVRPAPLRELRNISAISKDNYLFLITVKAVKSGEELLYWQDDNVSSNKKKLEKTILTPLFRKCCLPKIYKPENSGPYSKFISLGCGGCNMNFDHPIYYRIHCSVFHDIRYSLTIRKYHCKICGAAILGKENIMKHASTLHNGQGAYQCQFCKKVCTFMPMNYYFTNYNVPRLVFLKVHGLTEDLMPKIERSVDYTFEAYSGADELDTSATGSQHNKMLVSNQTEKECHNSSDIDDESMDDENMDDPLALSSPEQIQNNENSTNSDHIPTVTETTYTSNVKILTKGSKKWIADEPLEILKSDIYHIDKLKQCKNEESGSLALETEETQTYDNQKINTNLNTFNRHESSNASLLVEAALDSVCSEPNIDIDVNSTTNCTDSLVNNLYTLSHADALPDVTYSHSVDMNESNDINLISPSVNDHISVTDDLSDELRHTQSIGIDYSGFQQDDFSPPNSPNLQTRNNFVRDYINDNVNSPQNNQYETSLSKNVSPAASPPRYNFSHNINPDHISSDDSNGIGVQNLSIHNTKENIQLDLSIYKSHYNLDTSNFQFRKDFRIKFDAADIDRKLYLVGVDNLAKPYDDTHKFTLSETTSQNDIDNLRVLSDINQDIKHKDEIVESTLRTNLSDIRKFDLDLDLRVKPYENVDMDLRNRNAYDNTVDEFRIKNYDIVDNLETRNNLDGRNLLENDFRPDRSFDHLVLNATELQGLDMSARSYHNYSSLNRYHHLYSDMDRSTVDLRLNYNSPSQTYSHTDILRVVSLDLTPPGRHSVDLSLRSHQISNTRLLTDHSIQSNPHRIALDQSRILTSDLNATRLPPERLLGVSDISNRILSDHSTNRLLTNDSTNRLLGSEQRLLSDDSRLLSEQPRLLDQSRMLSDSRILPPAPNNGTISPVPYAGYSVSPTPYHPTALPARPHVTSPNPPYHHYSSYY
ncbi:zinc finger protein [Holotrichia oblita]|uniref:Zinc finger protein n=1 Tax=Holotrichia oblita TaxID=644536 RepID=A0ACB9TTQ9_HOLOL|nr:zinc finger protein [Holotrichia oblita]